ncbi:MAG TPA: PEGA domain-containing protein [Woeseiaceae bacterium]|nr:PEGA domain-containing protein [Woeseiaceae bacterium]
MSFTELVIRDVEGERRIDARDLPLRIGTSGDCGLRLPGPGSGPVVMLDILDGAPFVQPVGRDTSLTLNGEPLAASRRLHDGDELAFYGSRVRVRAGTELVLEVRLEDSAYVTQPPELHDADEEGAGEAIAPTAFRRAAETRAIAPEKPGHLLRNLVIAGLVTLAAVSWLLFTSKSVRFVVDPGEPDSVEIVGGWFALPLADRVLLRPGEYTLEVRKAGYFDVSQTFVVGGEPTQTVQVSLRRQPGRLTVVTTPAGAEATVSIDETHIGPAPLGPVELQPGEHSVRVQAPRFLPFSDIVAFEGLGQERVLNVQLVPRWAEVTVRSEPPGAQVFAGEKQVGTTPAVVELMEGTHPLSVVREGYKAWDGSVTVAPNEAVELPLIELDEANASLAVNSVPRGANVVVNGRYRGQSPLTLDLAPDTDYEIGLSKAGYGTASRKVRLASAARETITVDLTARTGEVTVNVSPADATVYVDGSARGQGTTTLALSSAPHRIEVRREGYESWSRTLTPRPGYPQSVTASLRSEEDIARAKIATVIQTAGGKSLRRVEPGSFTLGSSRSEQGRRANEVLVPVTITRAYYISTHEVTNREFLQFAAEHDSGAAMHPTLAADQNPVVNVSWAEAAAYCNYLSTQEGLTPVYEERFGEFEPILPFPDGYRLPTEAEWAWAVRFGGSPEADPYPWGSNWPPRDDAGNYADESAEGLVPTIIPGYDDGFAATAPVGGFPANRLGLFDAGGNVAEWVNDYYTVPTPGLTEPLRDPTGPEGGTSHVIRGSSWRHAGMTELRLSYRDYGSDARPDLGFRIVRNAE